jgi:hypothetical protein
LAPRISLSEQLIPLRLDPPTVADDGGFFESLAGEPNLPDYISEFLPDSF